MKLINLIAVLAAVACSIDVVFAMPPKKGSKKTARTSAGDEDRADREESDSVASESTAVSRSTNASSMMSSGSIAENLRNNPRQRKAAQRYGFEEPEKKKSRKGTKKLTLEALTQLSNQTVSETQSQSREKVIVSMTEQLKQRQQTVVPTTKKRAAAPLPPVIENEDELEEGEIRDDVPINVATTLQPEVDTEHRDSEEGPLVLPLSTSSNVAANESIDVARNASMLSKNPAQESIGGIPNQGATLVDADAVASTTSNVSTLLSTPESQILPVPSEFVTPEDAIQKPTNSCIPADHLTPEEDRQISDLPASEVEHGPIGGRYGLIEGESKSTVKKTKSTRFTADLTTLTENPLQRQFTIMPNYSSGRNRSDSIAISGLPHLSFSGLVRVHPTTPNAFIPARIYDLNTVDLVNFMEPIIVYVPNTFGDLTAINEGLASLQSALEAASAAMQHAIRQDDQYIRNLPPVSVIEDCSSEVVTIITPSHMTTEIPLTGDTANLALILETISGAILQRIAEYY